MGFIRNLGTGTPQIRLKDIRNLPIPIATTDQQTQIAELVDKIINLKKLSQDKISQVNTYLEAKFQIKSTKKLQKLYELENAEFLSELTKQKAKIDLKTEAQLLDYFQTEKVDLLELESQITQVDNQIEELVKGLYGLG
jgi:restriction endonuclease S subunit